MNIDTMTIGGWVVTSYSGRKHTLYNSQTDEVFNILPSEYAWIRENRSLDCVKWVVQAHRMD